MDGLRYKVDKIDSKIVRLLNKRAKTICKIARIKTSSRKLNYKDSKREKQIKMNLIETNEGPLESKHISYIYDEIFDAMIDIQEVEPLI
jgi:chorismate mutase/prephenate dehydratase